VSQFEFLAFDSPSRHGAVSYMLSSKRAWIVDAMKRVGETRRFLESQSVKHLPTALSLAALGETWSIVYSQDKSRIGIWLHADNGMLAVSGAQLSRAAVIRRLKAWLRFRVHDSLFPLARKLADKHHLQLRDVLVKSQRTRWASFSAQKNLSLNTKLLFLSPDLVRYAMIHELCHGAFMNHSEAFWRLVEAHEPGFRKYDQQLRESWKKVPQWMF
jgi:predicted metal-dependent hydrolase